MVLMAVSMYSVLHFTTNGTLEKAKIRYRAVPQTAAESAASRPRLCLKKKLPAESKETDLLTSGGAPPSALL